ncbi:LCP family protein [Geodermatophilus obscurus]|uniref:LCP family protein n=1 Tax=Geodermatophilus obscurus TaxID=1861 RepID=UPI00030E8475|nr:LCP family protein [Geodermatophilus obscurus]
MLVVVAGLTIGLGTLQVDPVAKDVARVSDAFPDEQDRPEVAEAAQEARTLLVVGVDPAAGATGATRAEAVLLVRLTGDRRHAQMVTFPLDTWVAEQSTTLEGVFGVDGRQGVVGAVETLTDVRVDHYAELDYAGFATVTDALGGVTVDVPEEYSNRGRTVPPGPQQMDGAAAVAYVRDASAATRAAAPERQQRVVQALFGRIGELGALADLGRLSGLLDLVTGALRVDESLADEDLVATAWEFRGVAEPEFVAAPVGSTGEEQGQPITRLDEDGAAALWGHLQADDLAAHLGRFR